MRSYSALALALAATAALAVAAPAGASRFTRTYHSRADLAPPKVFISRRSPSVLPGDIFLTPRPYPGQRSGPTIVDNRGNLVYFHPLAKGRTAIDFQPQTYAGRRVLTRIERPAITGANIYSGSSKNTYAVIVDDHYKELHRVHAVGRGVVTDLHDFVLRSDGTALLLGFRIVRRNLSSVGGPRNGTVVENLIQIIDVRTNKLRFDWHGLTHIPLSESMVRAPKDGTPYDYTHFNSVAFDRDGNIVASARHASTVYKISRRTGRIIWRLAGKRSSYRLGRGVPFRYQHDARPQPNGTYTLFDNHSSDFDVWRADDDEEHPPGQEPPATLVRQYAHPGGTGIHSVSQGNMQLLPHGNRFVGWGNSPYFTMYSPTGTVLLDGFIAAQPFQSYRAFHAQWTGVPPTSPRVAADQTNGVLQVWALTTARPASPPGRSSPARAGRP